VSSTTKKVPIDPESKRLVDEQLSTDDAYRELDGYIRQIKEEENVRKRRLVKLAIHDGEELIQEIDEKHKLKEEKRLSMIEYIFKNTKENFITIKESTKLPYEDLKPIYDQVVEYQKPWWRKIINMFR
jgi:hypothetical protein